MSPEERAEAFLNRPSGWVRPSLVDSEVTLRESIPGADEVEVALVEAFRETEIETLKTVTQMAEEHCPYPEAGCCGLSLADMYREIIENIERWKEKSD